MARRGVQSNGRWVGGMGGWHRDRRMELACPLVLVRAKLAEGLSPTLGEIVTGVPADDDGLPKHRRVRSPIVMWSDSRRKDALSTAQARVPGV